MGRRVVIAILWCWPALAGAQDVVAPLRGVRSPDPALRRLLNRAADRSETFRAVVERVEAQRGFVYVTPTVGLSDGVEGCLLHAIWRANENRYLRILVKWGLPSDYLMAIVAHELQHAVEVLEAPETRDAASIEMLFARIDTREPAGGGKPRYETRAAREAQACVFAELRRGVEFNGISRADASMQDSKVPGFNEARVRH